MPSFGARVMTAHSTFSPHRHAIPGCAACRADVLSSTVSAHRYNMTGVAEWLASIGLGEYADRFRENAIDLSVVRDLTEQDLKDLGVLLGHRRKMLRAIVELQGEVPRTPQVGAKPASADHAGRRQLTIMFCDLVGSSALSARLDLEDLRAVMGTYHRCIA